MKKKKKCTWSSGSDMLALKNYQRTFYLRIKTIMPFKFYENAECFPIF